MRLVLFDIDGTLLSSGKGPRRAFTEAVQEVCGVAVTLTYTIAAGNTDPGILRYVLSTAGFSDDRITAVTPQVFERYIEKMHKYYNATNDAILFDGVLPLLARLHDTPEVLLGLLTGNIEPGACIKLQPFGIQQFFLLGAYGSDDPERNKLPAVAVRRAEDLNGYTFKGPDVVVVGDTVKDHECGRIIDAKTIIVIRHPDQREPVAQARPDYIVDDFLDTEALTRKILS